MRRENDSTYIARTSMFFATTEKILSPEPML